MVKKNPYKKENKKYYLGGFNLDLDNLYSCEEFINRIKDNNIKEESVTFYVDSTAYLEICLLKKLFPKSEIKIN